MAFMTAAGGMGAGSGAGAGGGGAAGGSSAGAVSGGSGFMTALTKGGGAGGGGGGSQPGDIKGQMPKEQSPFEGLGGYRFGETHGLFRGPIRPNPSNPFISQNAAAGVGGIAGSPGAGGGGFNVADLAADGNQQQGFNPQALVGQGQQQTNTTPTASDMMQLQSILSALRF